MNKEEMHRIKLLEELEQDDFLEWQELDREIIESIEENVGRIWEQNNGCKIDRFCLENFNSGKLPKLSLDVNDYIKRNLK